MALRRKKGDVPAQVSPRRPHRKVGHKGADHIVPGNTRASFDAALDLGVDMIEFDVLPKDLHDRAHSPLVLAHDYSGDIEAAPGLEEGLEHLCEERFKEIELDVDLKIPGYEDRVVDALKQYDLIERTLVSSAFMRSLVKLRKLEPDLRLGWSVPRARRDYTSSRLWVLPALAAIKYMRRRLPERAEFHLREQRCDAIMVNWHLFSEDLLKTVHDAGADLYIWTVDDRELIRRFEALGVAGIITNDPRLFSPPEAV